MIVELGTSDFCEIVEVWEASVRATHFFLPEKYLQQIKSKLPSEYLPVMKLFGITNPAGKLSAFIGVCGRKIETLFVHPSEMGKGFGKTLLLFAVAELGADRVDVNEENPRAVSFYKKQGFIRSSRDEFDAEGRAHPILHMALRS